MLLDDVTSELDSLRRERLVEALREGGGQSVIATTDLGHVPGGDDEDVVHSRRRGDRGGSRRAMARRRPWIGSRREARAPRARSRRRSSA